jgi:hypothetical protein
MPEWVALRRITRWASGRSLVRRFLIAVGLGIPMFGPARLSAQAAELPLVTCQPGEELLLPESSVLGSDGWVIQKYLMDDGTSFERQVPPVRFNPATASQDILSRHRLSRNIAEHWTSRSYVSRDAGLCQPKIPVSAAYGNAIDVSEWWAGNLVKPVKSGTSFMSVAGIWQHPKLVSCAGAPGRALLSWVGIGGWSTHRLIQAGVAQWDLNAYSGVHPLQAFWEIVWGAGPSDHTPITSMNVRPAENDQLFAEVDYDGSSAAFWVDDMTTGQADNAVRSDRVAASYNGSTAEWIDERPQYLVQGYIQPLPSFGTDSWQLIRTSSDGSTFTGAHNGTWYPVEMTTDGKSSSRMLAMGSGIFSNDTACDYWHACS